MAEYTYQTRRKMTEDWVAHVKEKAGHLSKNEKQLLPGQLTIQLPRHRRIG